MLNIHRRRHVNIKKSDPLTTNIIETIMEIEKTDVRISLLLVNGHSGIQVNEKQINFHDAITLGHSTNWNRNNYMKSL